MGRSSLQALVYQLSPSWEDPILSIWENHLAFFPHWIFPTDHSPPPWATWVTWATPATSVQAD